MLELLLLSVGLAMDCVAVSAATAVAARGLSRANALKMALMFGGMQGLMAALGWLGGVGLARWIEAWDHWVAFGLLALIGGKMIVEGLRDDGGGEERVSFAFGPLLLLGLAVSIDAAAVGVSLPFLGVPFAVAIAVIGAVSALLSLAAVWLADRLAGRFAERLEILGGLVLIGIGVKILWEHLGH